MKKKKSIPVPVLMYHSIGIPDKKWNWNYLTCPVELFEDQLKALRKKGYESISLAHLFDYIFYSKPVPKKSIVFTFDDGYLDNWVFAYPLMKKYGFTGTIYVNPEFVDLKGGKRKRSDETSDIASLETRGFLSWDEMREMENEEVMYIESHALTHTWYPKSDTIVDFRHPGDSYIWMTWNNHVNVKYKLYLDNEELVQYGEPVYEYEKSLSGRRFFPDEGLKQHLCDIVKYNGGKSFFNKPNWRDHLIDEVANYKSNHQLNERYETDDEYHDRIFFELKTTKSIIESKLGKELVFHCWPGGSATKIGMDIANKLGFKLSNAANDIKEIRYKIKNNNQYRINRINRFSTVALNINTKNSKSFVKYSNGRFLLLKINTFTCRGFSRAFLALFVRINKAFLKLKYCLQC